MRRSTKPGQGWAVLPSIATLAASQFASIAAGSATAAIIVAVAGVLAVVLVNLGHALGALPDWLMRLLTVYQALWKWRRERYAAPPAVEVDSDAAREAAEDG